MVLKFLHYCWTKASTLIVDGKINDNCINNLWCLKYNESVFKFCVNSQRENNIRIVKGFFNLWNVLSVYEKLKALYTLLNKNLIYDYLKK